MFTFEEYIEKAKQNMNCKSVRELSEIIQIKPSSITEFSKGRAYPSQETMLRIARLAGIRDEQALIDFNLWKTKDKPNAYKVWKEIAKKIQILSVILVLSSLGVNLCYLNHKYRTKSIPTISENIDYATNI